MSGAGVVRSGQEYSYSTVLFFVLRFISKKGFRAENGAANAHDTVW